MNISKFKKPDILEGNLGIKLYNMLRENHPQIIDFMSCLEFRLICDLEMGFKI